MSREAQVSEKGAVVESVVRSGAGSITSLSLATHCCEISARHSDVGVAVAA